MSYILLGLNIDELRDRYSLKELKNIYSIVGDDTIPVYRIKVIDTSDFSILDLDIKSITSSNIEICGLGASDDYLKTDKGFEYLNIDLYGNYHGGKSLSYVPLFLNNKVIDIGYEYCHLSLMCKKEYSISLRVKMKDLSLCVIINNIILLKKYLTKDIELSIIKDDIDYKGDYYYKHIYTPDYPLDMYLLNISKNMQIYCDRLAIIKLSEDTFIPNGVTYANMMGLINRPISVVLPPSVEDISILSSIYNKYKVDLYISKNSNNKIKARLKDEKIKMICNIKEY